MRRFKALSAVAATALVLAACGGDDEEPETTDEPEDAGSEEEPDEGEGGEEEEAMTVATDAGVTEEACPEAVNPDNGCIYLGTITDLTGPFQGFGIPLTDAQAAFWARVNEMGGITAEGYDQAYDVDVATYNENSGYDPTEHARLFEEMEPDVLALAQTLGTPQTLGILPGMEANNVVAAPATYSSAWNFNELVLESSANYCVETMNSVDYAVDTYDVSTVMAVGFDNDYGGDSAAAAQIAAEAHGLDITVLPTPPGQDNQAEAVAQIVAESPDLVLIATGPTEAAAIVGGAAQAGYTGRFIGNGPTWSPLLLDSPAADAMLALYQVSGTFETYTTDTPGHQALRDALAFGDEEAVSDAYTIGWIWQYPLKTALEAALANGDLTRAGLAEVASSLETVDYEGMLPEGAGNFAGGAEAQLRETLISDIDTESQTGTTTVQDFFVGSTAEAWAPEVCFESE